jgi:hypothetical protein
MLFLTHNIHSGLNLNNLNILEQYSDYNLVNVNSSGNPEELKNINCLYVNKDIPFSF